MKKTAFIFSHNPTFSWKKNSDIRNLSIASYKPRKLPAVLSLFLVVISCRTPREKALFRMVDIDRFVGRVVLMCRTWKIDGLDHKPLWFRRGFVGFFETSFIYSTILQVFRFYTYTLYNIYVYTSISFLPLRIRILRIHHNIKIVMTPNRSYILTRKSEPVLSLCHTFKILKIFHNLRDRNVKTFILKLK